MITITKKKYIHEKNGYNLANSYPWIVTPNLPSGQVTNSSQIIAIYDHPSSSTALDNSGHSFLHK